MEDIMSYFIKLAVGLTGVMVVLGLLGNKGLAQITPLDFVRKNRVQGTPGCRI